MGATESPLCRSFRFCHKFVLSDVLGMWIRKAGTIVGTTQVLSRSMTGRERSSEHWDEAEFRAVFLQHYARIVAILMRLLGEGSRAEEVANDAFWRLYRQPALRVDGNLGGWLYRTATNLGIDALRASSRRRQYEEAAGGSRDEGKSNNPLEDLLREEKCHRVRSVLASIKPAQAQLLILRSSGLSYKELADALDMKISSVGTTLNRAEEEFRNRYLATHPNEEEL
jgi:RNA polymerase sigma-70 factor, ECF subfamily